MEEVRWLRKLEKGVRHDPYIIIRRGNENQYCFCEEIADHLNSSSCVVVRQPWTGQRKALREDVFSSGVWPLLSNLEDPELRRLAKALPATVLRCKADSTAKKYLGAYQRWKTWAEARRVWGGGGGGMFPCTAHPFGAVLAAPQSKSAVEEAGHGCPRWQVCHPLQGPP